MRRKEHTRLVRLLCLLLFASKTISFSFHIQRGLAQNNHRPLSSLQGNASARRHELRELKRNSRPVATKVKHALLKVLKRVQLFFQNNVLIWLFRLVSLRIECRTMCVYILECEDNHWYVGSTSRSARERFSEHARERGGSKWTSLHKPIRLHAAIKCSEEAVYGLESK